MDKTNQITIEFKCFGHPKDAERCDWYVRKENQYCASSEGGQCTNNRAKEDALKQELEDMKGVI
jgi:hypothetical protein